MTGRQWFLVLSVLVILAASSPMWSRGLLAVSALQQLTTDPAADMRSVWSPDGQRIAFQSSRSGSWSIWTMDADGKNQREVTPGVANDRHPAWSPDGKQLAFDSDASGSREIWIVESDGQNRRQLTSLGTISNFPAWSPDGTQVAFYVYQEGTLNLWAVRVDGSNLRPVTLDLANVHRDQCTFACHRAAWSPDGQQIAYSGGDHQSIWLIDADGSNPTEIVAGKEHNHFPWYTREGRIGYLAEHIALDGSWTDAWVLDPQSGGVELLLDGIQIQGPLEWSPDGTKLLFHSPRSGNFDIYGVDLLADGGREALQTKPDLAAPSPERDPDSTAAGMPTGGEQQPAVPASSPERGPDAAVPGTPAPEKGPDAAASVAPPGEEAELAASEATSSAWFASPLILGTIGLIGLVGLGVVVAVLVIRRNRRI